MTVEPFQVPFTVLIDTAESHAWTFDGLEADANKDYRPLAVPITYRALGRHPHGLGDYSIDGLADRVAVERKSLEDIWGTVMGWPTKHQQEGGGTGRRERFKKELENLAKIDSAAVVIEATLGNCLANVPEFGKRCAEHNQKIFFRSVISMQQDFKVPWQWLDSRRLAEIWCFRFLERFHRKHKEKQK